MKTGLAQVQLAREKGQKSGKGKDLNGSVPEKDAGRLAGNGVRGLRKIELGCGKKKREGFIGIDLSSESDADILHDLSKGLPPNLKAGSVEHVYSHHFLEHLNNPGALFKKDFKRVCREGALVESVVPHYSAPAAFEPKHLSWFSLAWFVSLKYWGYELVDSSLRLEWIFGEQRKRLLWRMVSPLVHAVENFFNKSIDRQLFLEKFLRGIFPIREIHATVRLVDKAVDSC